MQITPEAFDLVVIGTGLQEALIASSAALDGKSVLHVDPNPYYGDSWAGLNIIEFQKHISPMDAVDNELEPSSNMHVLEGTPHLYSNVEISKMETENLGPLQDYIIDLAPKVTYQASPLLRTLIQTQAHHHVDYRLVDAGFMNATNSFNKIPTSRSDIFKDKTLTALQKRGLTVFLKTVVEMLENQESPPDDFETWMEECGLDFKMKKVILSGVCFEEQNPDSLSKFEALGLCLQSAGRLRSNSGPFVLPFYSPSDAFCRLCAVNGGVYVLNCAIKAIHYDRTSEQGIHIVTQYDQRIDCSKLCLPAYYLNNLPSLNALLSFDILKRYMVSRSVCILDRSLKPNLSQIFISVPTQDQSIAYFLQIGPPACPEGKYLLYGYRKSRSSNAKADLEDLVHTFFQNEDLSKTEILFECYYNQNDIHIPQDPLSDICFTGMPNGFIDAIHDLKSAEEKFHWLFKTSPFFPLPQNVDFPDDSDDEKFLDLENELAQFKKH